MVRLFLVSMSRVSAEARRSSSNDCVGAVGGVRLRQNARYIVSNGLGAEEERSSDGRVVLTTSDEIKDLQFTGTQNGEGIAGPARVGGEEVARQSARDGGTG